MHSVYAESLRNHTGFGENAFDSELIGYCTASAGENDQFHFWFVRYVERSKNAMAFSHVCTIQMIIRRFLLISGCGPAYVCILDLNDSILIRYI